MNMTQDDNSEKGVSRRVWSPPKAFEEYQLVRLLGRGSVGSVWLAKDTNLDINVAIKFLLAERRDEQSERRFQNEARALARLRHPNVISVYRFGTIGAQPYLVYEYLSGKPFDALELPFDGRDALLLARGLARGLAAAHRRGILHRDIKMSNVFLGNDGSVKLIDFGLAKIAGCQRARLTRPGDLLGTPRYMAPELWRGAPATRQSDVFALGVTLYHLVTGKHPHPAQHLNQLIYQMVYEEVPSLLETHPHVPSSLAHIIDCCLRSAPERRFASGEAICTALESVTEPPLFYRGGTNV